MGRLPHKVTLHVPCPAFDDVAGRIGHVQRLATIIVVERDDLGVVAVFPQPRDRTIEIFGVDVHRVMNVETPASARDSKLRRPEADTRLRSGHEPDPSLRAIHHWEPEHAGVESFSGREVNDLENEFAHTAHRNGVVAHAIAPCSLYLNNGSCSGVIPERSPSRASSLTAVEDQQRRDARRAYKQAERGSAHEAMVLAEAQLSDLLDYLDDHVAEAGCDHTLRFTEAWAGERGIQPSALVRSVQQFGGYCDCEVVANVEPELIF